MGNGTESELDLASAIEKWTGIDAATYAAERIDALSRADNPDGAQRFRIIAAQLDRARSDGDAPNASSS